jgi:hypothetical protein
VEQPKQYLFPPPRLVPRGEPRPTIEPQLRDMAPFPGEELVDEWEPFASESAENALTVDLTRQAEATAMADARVKRLLADKRYAAIGVSLREQRDAPKERATSLVCVFYNYTDNIAVEVALDRNARKVGEVRELREQPAPTRQELEQAIMLARGDSRLADKLTDDLEGTAILVSPVDPDDPQFGHRQFDVRFICPTERLPRYAALVDLSTETVLEAGRGCGIELQD